MAKKRKPRESFGAIRTLPSGRIQASYTGHDGKRYNAPRTFDAKVDARQWLFDRRKELEGETWEPPAAKARRVEPFGEYAAEWITRRRVKGKPLRPRTREEYERLLKGPLSTLAEIPLNKVTRDIVDTWHREQSATGRTTQTSRAYALLKAVFADAVDRNYLTTTPAHVRGGATPKTGRVVMPPTDAQLTALKAAMVPEYRALVTVASAGALRYGEATELRRKDVTKRKSGAATIRVERAVVQTRAGSIVGPPKSAAGVRSVTLPTHASKELFDHLNVYVAEDSEALLFPAEDGGHMPQWKYNPHWRRAREAAGRPDLGFHALRHYALTRFAQAPGVTLAAVMGRAGHSSVTAAMGYQHAAADLDAKLAEQMSEAT